jgi:hypothetical protein
MEYVQHRRLARRSCGGISPLRSAAPTCCLTFDQVAQLGEVSALVVALKHGTGQSSPLFSEAERSTASQVLPPTST